MLNDAGYGALNGSAINENAINADGGGVTTPQNLWRTPPVRQPIHSLGGMPFALRASDVSLPPGRGTQNGRFNSPARRTHQTVMGSPLRPAPPPGGRGFAHQPARPRPLQQQIMGCPSNVVYVNFYVRGTIVG